MTSQTPPSNCDGCSACCRGRSGTVLVLEADIQRWDAAGRRDLIDGLVEGHFGQRGLAADSLGDCIHLEDRRCTIYALRPDTCRDFEVGCPQCLVARRSGRR